MATSCPEPSAHAFDHHEGIIDVDKAVKIVMISRPKQDPQSVDMTMATLNYHLRASYVLTYDAGAYNLDQLSVCRPFLNELSVPFCS